MKTVADDLFQAAVSPALLGALMVGRSRRLDASICVFHSVRKSTWPTRTEFPFNKGLSRWIILCYMVIKVIHHRYLGRRAIISELFSRPTEELPAEGLGDRGRKARKNGKNATRSTLIR